jgi:hypothetical protein
MGEATQSTTPSRAARVLPLADTAFPGQSRVQDQSLSGCQPGGPTARFQYPGRIKLCPVTPRLRGAMRHAHHSIQLIHCLFFWTSLGRTRRGTKDEGQAGGLLLVSALTFWEPKQESRRVARKTNPPDGSFPVLSSHTHGFPTDDKRASVAEPYCHWRRLTSSMHRATRLPAQSRYLSYSF